MTPIEYLRGPDATEQKDMIGSHGDLARANDVESSRSTLVQMRREQQRREEARRSINVTSKSFMEWIEDG